MLPSTFRGWMALWACGCTAGPLPVLNASAPEATLDTGASTARAALSAPAPTLLSGRVELGVGVGLRPLAGGALGLAARGLPEDGACVAAGAQGCERRAELRLEGGTAWFRGVPEGLQQGWTVHGPDGEHAHLVLDTGIDGATPRVSPGGRTATLHGGRRTWSVGALSAVDAAGRRLPARFEAVDPALRVLRVRVDVRGAAWPVTVDPVYEVAATLLTETRSGAEFGRRAFGVGDVDVDGFDDVVVSAPGLPGGGAVQLFRGTALGVDPVHVAELVAPGDVAFGEVAAAAGDVDGDGRPDLLVLERHRPDTGSREARVYHGATGTYGPDVDDLIAGSAADDFGRAMTGLGDVDGDGQGDIAIGAPLEGTGAPGAGAVYVYRGGRPEPDGAAAWYALGEAQDEHLGAAIAGPGDVAGDALPDLVVGAPGYPVGPDTTGRVLVYAATGGGISVAPTQALLAPPLARGFGRSLDLVGDLSGDGRDDLVVGAADCAGSAVDAGCALLFLGGPGGLAPLPAAVWQGAQAGDAFGASVSRAGDVDGDGYGDVIIGAPHADVGAPDSGSFSVLGRTPAGPPTSPQQVVHGTGAMQLGLPVGAAGDVNGDGLDDVIVGAVAADGGAPTSGAAWVHLGRAVDEDADGVPASIDCDDQDAGVGRTLVWYVDADGDGYGRGDQWQDACELPPGHAAAAGDCDDAHSAAHPGGAEVCDDEGVDEDCDGAVDDLDPDVDPTSLHSWFIDGDGDGWGVDAGSIAACDAPGRTTRLGDCNDEDGAIHPDAREICDPLDADEDCSGVVEDADPDVDPASLTRWHLDGDADGFGDPDVSTVACDRPAGYRADGTDCHDGDPTIRPDATEACDPLDVDEDCDARADDADDAPAGQSSWYADDDGDGHGRPSGLVMACDVPTGHVVAGDDCDDTRDDVHPGADEVCDALNEDEDCDGRADDDDFSALPSSMPLWYLDADHDGHGDPIEGYPSCDGFPFHVSNDTDCDDSRADVSPEADEVCDALDVDEDCDGAADDADTSALDGGKHIVWSDGDGDGHGDPATTLQVCDSAPGHVAVGDDCDDDRADISPEGAEVCDGLDADEDCDGTVDDADPSVDPASHLTWYLDFDGDGAGTTVVTAEACGQPIGYSALSDDCDDARPDVHPRAPELCDRSDYDEDCDGLVDDRDDSVDPGSLLPWYADLDGDRHGDPDDVTWSCEQPADRLATGRDCDDTRSDVHPGAPELCDAADADEDCDGDADDDDPSVSHAGYQPWYRDADDDGYGDHDLMQPSCDPADGFVAADTDCDDHDPTVSPEATEVCDPADVDEDCDGDADDDDASHDPATERALHVDADGDLHGHPTLTVGACDPGPGAVPSDDDCDDGRADVHPGADEVCDAQDVDEDCDGDADDADDAPLGRVTWYADQDGDGSGDAGTTTLACDDPGPWVSSGPPDCDDARADVHPGGAEVCDPADADEDCDGDVDDDDASVSATSLLAWYPDDDGDGWGDGAGVQRACAAPGEGWTALSGDCDDDTSGVRPDAQEVCDPADLDEDCDGDADDADASVDAATRTTFYADSDGDGFGDLLTATLSCDPTSGQVAFAGDCDDLRGDVSPAGAEICDPAMADEDCDGVADDDDPAATGQVAWYLDVDGDAYGDLLDAMSSCHPASGRVADATDCDDADADIHPGAQEVCDAADADEDCDGAADDLDDSVDLTTGTMTWADADGDGYGDDAGESTTCDPAADRADAGGDCDDDDAAIHPDATEDCDDGVDGDCNGQADDVDPACEEADTDIGDGDEDKGTGCACSAGGAPVSGLWLLALVPVLGRRRRVG